MTRISLLLCAYLLSFGSTALGQFTYNVGPPDNSIGTGGNFTTLTEGLFFDAMSAFTIDSFTCYPFGAGDIVVNLLDSTGTMLQSYTQTAAGPGAVVVTPAFNISPGMGYQINAALSTTGGLYRNNAGASFPYAVPGVMAVTGTLNNLPTFYYFFYDWTISTATLSIPTWQSNQSVASMDFNGTQGTAETPARNIAGEGSIVSFSASTSLGVGKPADILLSTAAIVPSPTLGSFITSGGQVVNLNLTTPFFSFFGGVSLPIFFVPWPGDVAGATFTPPLGRIAGQMVVIDPSQVEGFSLSQATSMEIVPCSAGSNFESLPLGTGNYPMGWGGGDFVTSGAIDWTVNELGTASANTGPSTGASGSGNYLYCETTAPNSAATFVFETCDIDISTNPAPMLSLEFNASGASIGVLTVEEITPGGGGPIAPAVTIHPGGDLGDLWNAHLSPVTAGSTVRLRFTYVAGGSFTGDIALDNISIQ